MGISLLFIEWSIGRYGGKSGNHRTTYILDSMSKRPILKYIGVFGVFNNFVVVAYYTYTELWTLIYVIYTLSGTFTSLSQHEITLYFSDYINFTESDFGIPLFPVLVLIFLLGMNVYTLSRGLSGIEKVAKIGMLLLILFGVILALKGGTMETENASVEFPMATAWDGINLLWTPQYDFLANPKV